jgi:translation initiation factor 2B subunit (eIF-2B alpha/beta/delta family)
MPYHPGENQMSENIAQTVQKVIQDLVAPDVRELKTLVTNLQSQLTHAEGSLQKQIDQRFEAQDKKAETQNQKADAQFRAIMSALGEFKAQSELTTIRVISQLSERVAVLEAHR